MLLDLSGQGLRKAGEEGESRLASFGRAPGEVEVGDIGRYQLDQGFADHRIDHRVHLGVEPMNVAVRILDAHHFFPLSLATLEHRRDGGVDLRSVVGVDAIHPRGRVVGVTRSRRDLEEVTCGPVCKADVAVAIHRQNQHRQRVEKDLDPVAEALQTIRECGLGLQQGNVLEDRTERRRAEA